MYYALTRELAEVWRAVSPVQSQISLSALHTVEHHISMPGLDQEGENHMTRGTENKDFAFVDSSPVNKTRPIGCESARKITFIPHHYFLLVSIVRLIFTLLCRRRSFTTKISKSTERNKIDATSFDWVVTMQNIASVIQGSSNAFCIVSRKKSVSISMWYGPHAWLFNPFIQQI